MRIHYAVAVLLTAQLSDLSAQIKASEPARISQTVDGTELTIEYSRPRVRGRDSVFGKEVTWDEVWTPGANWATTLETSKDIRINGHPLAKGKYAIWMVVRPALWTMVFDPKHHVFHINRPDSTAQQLRFDLVPAEGSFTETLTFSFPDVRVTGTTLVMQWGTIRVPLEIQVPPSYALATARAQAGPYLGSYAFAWTEKEPGDSSGPMNFTVTYQDSTLVGEFNPAPWPGAQPMVLIPIRKNWFIPGWLEQGELYEVDKEMVLEFAVKGGKASGFEVRTQGDTLLGTGKRRP